MNPSFIRFLTGFVSVLLLPVRALPLLLTKDVGLVEDLLILLKTCLILSPMLVGENNLLRTVRRER